MSKAAFPSRRAQLLSAAIVAALLSASCSESSRKGEVRAGGEGSCAFVVTFGGERYVGRQVLVEPPLGKALGEGVIPSCDDTNTGESVADERIPVVELVGIDPSMAIAWEGQPSSILVREDIDLLPAELERYFERPVCDPSHEPIRLFGTWVGIIGPGETTELDLVPPYDLELLVSVASEPEYQGADLSVRVPASAGRLVTKKDIRTALWEGGSIEMTVRCSGARFLADTVGTYPG
jgi:hypothetical protein